MESFIVSAISMGIVYLFGCTGEIIQEKAGNLNLGIPGIMCLGALGGSIGVKLYNVIFGDNIISIVLFLMALIFSIIFSMLGGLIYSFLTVTLQANQNVTGLVLTTFGTGVMKFVGSMIYDQTVFINSSSAFKTLFPFYTKLGGFGKIFLSYGPLIYIGIILAIVTSFVLNKTKTGLFLRSIGESPETADAQGINVTLYKYMAILIGSAIAGLGGLYYVMDRSGGTTFVEAQIDAFGWLAVALVIFSMWKPLFGIIGSIVFGGLYILQTQLVIPNDTIKLFAMLPYVVTVLVLIITSILDAKEAQPPRALGINYYREDR